MQLGLGTAALGRPQYINLRQEDASEFDLDSFKQNSINVLEEAYHSGIRYFDTAPGYGIAENIVLDWLQTKNDKAIKIATKWGTPMSRILMPKLKFMNLKSIVCQN